jgi:hypothetical protein
VHDTCRAPLAPQEVGLTSDDALTRPTLAPLTPIERSLIEFMKMRRGRRHRVGVLSLNPTPSSAELRRQAGKVPLDQGE